jgi:surface antigen
MIFMIRIRFSTLLLAFGLLLAPLGAAQAQYWQCAPFARAISGVQLFGNAAGWWDQAAGRYARGNTPAVGAVLAFRATPGMRAGHVAVVDAVIDARTLSITHANWSPINGSRGQIERGVTVIDVSAANDWSAVRVWYAPIRGIGRTSFPTYGFIMPAGVTAPTLQMASID